MTMELRTLAAIKTALQVYQQNRHPYLRDYSDYSTLTTVNESMAVQVQYVEERSKAAIEANSIWMATGNDLDILVSDRGITREDGTRATGTITFRTSTPTAVTIFISAGTKTSAIAPDGNRIYFETTQDANIDAGYTSVNVPAQAVETGTDGNVAAYAVNSIAVYIPGVSRVENVAAFSGGTEEEDDEDLRERYIYATDINGRATLPLMEQHIYDLENVTECQIFTKSPGEIEIVADTSLGTTLDQTVVDCIEENIAAGIAGRGKILATIDGGVLTPTISVIAAGKLYVRVESNLVTSNESFSIIYTSTTGLTRTATVEIPTGSVKGDVIEATMQVPTDLAVQVDGYIYTGSNDYSILGGFGTYPYLYITPRIVLCNVTIKVTQTTTPDPDLDTKIEASIESYLDDFNIGDDVEFSDLIPYIYMDYDTRETTKDQFIGIEQITSVIITAKDSSISGFGQTISLESDERIEPGSITITLS